jgi:hypothetical protein
MPKLEFRLTRLRKSHPVVILFKKIILMAARIPTDYEFDAFISYSHSPVVRPWVLKFFGPYLKYWLPHYMGVNSVRVFIDEEEITAGKRWPQYIRDALLASKCLVPVLSGDYFNSSWCFSEWTNFVDRENILDLDTTSENLIVPILHNDGRWFPARANEYQFADFQDCRSNSPKFENHDSFPIFERKVESLAENLAEVIARVPPFNAGWPTVEIDPVIRTVPLMRIT